MHKRPIIFLDYDGVLVSFTKKCIDTFDLDITDEDIKYYYALNDYMPDIHKRIEEIGHDFWATIPKFKYADNLVQDCIRLVGVDNVYISTTPMKHEGSYSGKFHSIHNSFPQISLDNIILNKRKYLKAGNKNRILVDDKTENCENWEKAGGTAIIYPRPWNGHFNLTELEKYNIVKNKLESLLACVNS